ncbi:MAG: PIG-L family deacetylase [Candidatus Omnitrophica bacterium]|nr:PIG-L family deacetylase [Candidatus Omnitrophota bacterium]MDD5653265.1 PIG-L family deacetylase [Candidatus Omnitrophota bacterium]
MIGLKVFSLIFTFACLFGMAQAQPIQASAPEKNEFGYLEPFSGYDRVLVLAPHPDDEAIGCAGVIQEALAKNANIHVVYLTNGDHNEFAFIVYEKRIVFRTGEFIHLGGVRRKEAVKAMDLLGLDESELAFLGYPDNGTFTMFKDYWQEVIPYQSLLTRINKVPYKENFSYGLSYKPGNILADLEKLLLKYRPNKIFVSHPADANLDHETFYLFLQVALSNIEKDLPRPKVYPYLIHVVGWPLPRNYHPELPLFPPEKFLDTPISWVLFGLKEAEVEKKHQAILCYKSQTESSAFYLLSFARKNELFGDYPPVELKFPQAGPPKQVSVMEKTLNFIDGLRASKIQEKKPVKNNFASVTQDKGKITYSMENDDLLIRINKPQRVKNLLHTIFYLFGYSHKTPFAEMPKLSVITKYNTLKVFDGKNQKHASKASLEFKGTELTLRIPLKELGNPDYILLDVKAYMGITPFYISGFRKVTLRR